MATVPQPSLTQESSLIESSLLHFLKTQFNWDLNPDLLSACKLVSIPSGIIYFEQGDPLHNIFLVLRGALKIIHLDREGQSSLLSIIKEGEFGGLFLTQQATPTFPHRFITHGQTSVLLIPVQKFLSDWQKEDSVQKRILASTQQRMRDLQNGKIMQFQHSESRVAYFLLRYFEDPLSQPNGSNWKRREIAAGTGLKEETVIRALTHFTKLGWISKTRTAICVTNRKELEKLASSFLLS